MTSHSPVLRHTGETTDFGGAAPGAGSVRPVIVTSQLRVGLPEGPTPDRARNSSRRATRTGEKQAEPLAVWVETQNSELSHCVAHTTIIVSQSSCESSSCNMPMLLKVLMIGCGYGNTLCGRDTHKSHSASALISFSTQITENDFIIDLIIKVIITIIRTQAREAQMSANSAHRYIRHELLNVDTWHRK